MSTIVVSEGRLHGVKVIGAQRIEDDRGWFVRTSDTEILRAAGIDPAAFVQESQSRSRHGVLRGLHGRRALSEAKLVRCAAGEVFEAIVDLRPWSPTFLEHETMTLDDVGNVQVYIPPGCVHGYQTLSPQADICYRMDAVYAPDLGLALAHDDPALGIAWPMADPVLSRADQEAPPLHELRPRLEDYYGATAP